LEIKDMAGKINRRHIHVMERMYNNAIAYQNTHCAQRTAEISSAFVRDVVM